MVLIGVACTCHKHIKDITCGRCSLCLSNLTGEPQAQEKQAPERTSYWTTPPKFNNQKLKLKVPKVPTRDMGDFTGELTLGNSGETVQLTGRLETPRFYSG